MRRKITGWILVLTMLTGVLCSCGVRGEWNHTDREYAVVESMYERTELWCMVVAALDQFKM